MARILIVEDDALIIRLYQRVFLSKGYEVATATNGEEALGIVRSVNPDLILLDIMMPKLNGLETLKQLKAIPGIKKIPVVILTNLSSAVDAKTALQEGAVKYLIKSDYKLKEVFDIVDGIVASYTRDEPPAT